MPPTPASPPKRMTRARAKAVEEKNDAIRPLKQGAFSTRGTSKTVNQKATAEVLATETAEVKRSTRTKTAEVSPRLQSEVASVQAPGKSTRGRPRKATAEVDKMRSEPMTSKAATITRTRAAAAPKASSCNVRAAPKKKVAFQEDLEAEKENIIETTKAKKATAAGPKPAATTRLAASARTNQKAPAKSAIASNSSVKGDATRAKDPKPLALSPKKDSQVAKVVPAESEEDELSGEKTPLKPLRESPQKLTLVSTQVSPKKTETHNGSSIKEYDADQPDELHTALPISPTKSSQGAMFASPPKRLPASPFKDAFKISPKKMGDTPSKPGTAGPSNNFKDSVLLKSPMKFNFGCKSQAQQDAPADLKASILQSPRRPPSPLKGFNSGSCIRVATSQQAIPASVLSTTPRKLLFSPHKSLVASTGAVNPPEFSSKLQKPAAEVQNTFSAEQKSRIPIRSPPRTTAELSIVKVSNPTATPQLKAVETSIMLADIPSLTPLGNPSPATAKAFALTKSGFQDGTESEDELQSSQTQFNIGTPTPGKSMKTLVARAEPGPMTVLAERFMSWQGSTPDEKILDQRKVERSIFSPVKMNLEMNGDSVLGIEADVEPQLYSEFEEAMAVREDPMETTTQTEIEKEDCFRQSVVSDASQEYGDENAMPLDAPFLILTDDRTMTCTPARISRQSAKVLHTVSKVPLKPAADELRSPLKIQPVRRTKSLSGVLSPRADLEVQMLRQLNPVVPESIQREMDTQNETYTPQKSSAEGEMNQTPKTMTGSGSWSVAATPARTPRADLNFQLLRGAVVFVDVHTTEGADASGIFIELLSQMGAKCVKQWNWNPRASLHGLDVDDSECGKIGITHVVFKDGGKRTMEKVREAKGVVLCVGVGWVLDCERENKWLDEADYMIDVSTVPRGGHRRRKSMEPKRLSSWNGNLFEAASAAKQAMSPSKEFLNLDTPQSRRNTVGTATPLNVEKRVRIAAYEPLKTPNVVEHNLPEEMTPERYMEDDATAGFGSPTTPYFLHKEQLTQQTCPPKQTQQLLFPLTGIIDDQPDEAVRKRLWLARRKSLQFAPKVGSPLKD